jgi:hypothetical protein
VEEIDMFHVGQKVKESLCFAGGGFILALTTEVLRLLLFFISHQSVVIFRIVFHRALVV